MAEPTTNLRVRISGDLADIKSALASLRGDLAKTKAQGATALPNTKEFVGGLNNARNLLRNLFVGISVGAVFKGIIDNTREAEDATGQLQAALESTKGAAGVTTPQIQALAASLQKVTTYGDDTIVRMAAMLASFTNIRGGIYKDAIPAILDLATRLQKDLPSAAILVGKALNDPVAGLTALSKAGVQFTDSQKKVIKSLVDSGQGMQAQRLILDQLNARFGGAATTAANTFVGSIDQAKNAIGDLLEGDSGSGGMLEAKTAVQSFTAVLQDAGTKTAFATLLAAFATGVTKLIGALKSIQPVVTAVLNNLDTLAVFLGTRLAAGAIIAAIQGFLKLKAAILAAREAMVALSVAELLVSGPVGLIITAVAALAAGVYLLATRTDLATAAAKKHAGALDATRQMALLDREAAIKDAIAKRELAIQSLNAAKAALQEARARAAALNSSTPLGALSSDTAAFTRGAAAQKSIAAKALVDELQKEVDDFTKTMIDLGKQGLDEQVAGITAEAANFNSGGGDAKKKVQGIIDQAEVAIDAIKRQQQALDELFDKGSIKISDYFAKKQALALQDIDLQIAQAQAEAKAATSTDEQSKALTNIVKLQAERAAIGPQTARDQAAAEQDLAKQLGEVQIRLLEASGETARARTAQLEEEFKKLITRLETEGDTAGVALVRKLINVEAADAQLQQFGAKMQDAMSRLQGTESSVAAQQQAGLLGDAAGDARVADARARALADLKALRQAAIEYLATLSADSPEGQKTLAYLDQLNANIADVTASQHQLRGQFQDAATSSLSTFFTDLASGAVSAGQAVKNLALNFTQMIGQIAAAELAKKAVSALFSLFNKGSNSSDVGAGATKLQSAAVATGLAGGVIALGAQSLKEAARQLQEAAYTLLIANGVSIAAGSAHGGGVIGMLGAKRQVSPLLLGAAPRYHGGGIAGLRPNEVGAVLERGEEVLTKNDPRHRNNGGLGASGAVTTPIVAFGDEALADALAGAAGERVVLTHVRNNWSGLMRGGND